MSAKEVVGKKKTPEILNECGLFAIILLPGKNLEEEVELYVYQGLTDQQHRAEGSAGIYISNGKSSEIVKELGTVAVAFQEGRNLPSLKDSYIGIGHTRYPTAGSTNHRANIQPLRVENNGNYSVGETVLAHHGNLTNMTAVLPKLNNFPMGGVAADSDSWIGVNAIAQAEGNTLGEKVINAQRNFEGAWSFIASDGKTLVASRDPYGTRPLSIARLGPEDDPIGYVLAVEDSTFQHFDIDEDSKREILPGETIQIDENGLQTIELCPAERQYFCVFEYFYMSSIASTHLGKPVYEVRRSAGNKLWQEIMQNQSGEDLVIMPVPDSGRGAALGLYHAANDELGHKVKYDEGLIANRYFGRNFIKEFLKRNAKKKFNSIPQVFAGKKIMLVDDSLVRGDTLPRLVELCRAAGAVEVHVAIAFPPLVNPCRRGVAMPTREAFLANRIPDLDERRKFIGADSFTYLSHENMLESVGSEVRDKLCTECLDGNGPPMSVDGVIPLSEIKRRPS